MLGGMACAAVPGDPQGEDRRARGGHHDHDERRRGSLVAWALHHPLRTTPPGRNDRRSARRPSPPGARVARSRAAVRLRVGAAPVLAAPARDRAASACGSCCAGCAWGTRLGLSAPPRGPPRAGGISIGGSQIQVFVVSGALAGLIGMQQILADKGLLPQLRGALGFTGIAVAFLGRNNPIGIIFAAILWGILSRGEVGLQIATAMPREFMIVLQGVLILAVVITYQIARRRLRARQLRREAIAEGRSWTPRLLPRRCRADAARRPRRRAPTVADLLHRVLPDGSSVDSSASDRGS